MLETIPTYRMVLDPQSFLPEQNPDKKVIDLICDLPNAQNQYRKNVLASICEEKHLNYYLKQLLLETKIFIREMLKNCCIDDTQYRITIDGQNLSEMFVLIESKRLVFFKYLILNDLVGLTRGHMESEIKASISIDEIRKHIKKYGMMQKLLHKVFSDYKQMEAIYC